MFSCVSIRIIDIMRIDIDYRIALSHAVCDHDSCFLNHPDVGRRFETEEDAIRIMRKSDKIIASNF